MYNIIKINPKKSQPNDHSIPPALEAEEALQALKTAGYCKT